MENGINENFKIICINFFIDTKESQNEILKILRKVKDFVFHNKNNTCSNYSGPFISFNLTKCVLEVNKLNELK